MTAAAQSLPLSASALLSDALPLALALALPLAIAAWLRIRALRGIARDPDVAWFGYARTAQWVIIGGWLSWFAALSPSPLLRDLFPAFARAGLPVATALLCLLCAVPPALLSLAIQALVHDVRRRASATTLTLAEALGVTAWQMAAGLIPLSFIVMGAVALMWRQPGLGIAGLFGALLSRLWLLRRALDVLGTVPQAVTSGPLRDRIFELASRAGVRLKQIYLMPMARIQGANAFAISNGTVMLTDVLLEQLSEREVVAIMAHEITHLRLKHPKRIAQTGLFVLISTLLPCQFLALKHLVPSVIAVIVPVFCCLFATLLARRRFEFEADAGAAELSSDPQALITGLTRISALNHMPMHWGPWAERSLTHPSTRRRIVRIAERAKLEPAEVERLISAPPAAAPHFEISPALAAGRLFSSRWKMRVSANLTLLLIAIQAGIPALVVRMSYELNSPFHSRPLVLLAATVIAALAM
ncbi:MAG: M48 family metallopeptidase, partial [Candidatus Eiseniibacteriota bacterium]